MTTNSVLIKTGNPISFADHANDFGPSTNAVIEHDTPTDVELQMASLSAAAAVNSNKVDLGIVRSPEYSVMACFEVASGAAVEGETVDLYWAPSNQAADAVGNPGGVDGSNGAYAGTGASSLANSLTQLVFIGSLVATLDDTADSPDFQIAEIGTFSPGKRYGSMVVVNNLTGAFHTDDINMNIVMTPIIPDIQAAA